MAAKSDSLKIMSREDQSNYMQLVDEWFESGKLDAGKDASGNHAVTVPYITQVFSLNGAYIGAWIIVDGPRETYSYGPMPAYRYWIFVNTDWEEILFKSIVELYRHVATLTADQKSTVRIHMYFLNKSNVYQSQGESIFTLSKHVSNHGS